MVVFTCNHCGESLRKPAVEKHYNFVCRKVKSLTCVDCFKDFREEEYVVHTKCITEEERYAAKGSMPNGVVKKGELKQESWVDMIKSILEDPTLTPSQKDLLSTISNYSNVPRKKPKFLNFIRSSSGGRVNMKNVEDVWNIIERYKNKTANQKLDSNKRKSTEDTSNDNDTHQPKKKCIDPEELENNETVEINPPKSKKKKKKIEQEETENNESVETTLPQSMEKKKKNKQKMDTNKLENCKNGMNGMEEEICIEKASPEEETEAKFNFLVEISQILERKTTISLKKLQKKVINAYLKHTGKTEITPKTVKKFNKNLKKLPNVEILDDNVSLKTT